MLPSQVPLPPVDMVMPAQYGLILAINFFVLLVVVVMALIECRRSKRSLPILILIGATSCAVLECFFDVLVCAWWPQYGHTPLYRLFNMSVPTWMALAYPWYYGGMSVLAYKWFKKGMTTKNLWTFYWLGWVANLLLEVPALQLGVYTYYGTQPFKLLDFPLVMAAPNAVVPLLIGALITAFDDLLVGAKSLLTIFLVPMGMATAQVTIAWPWWIAVNSSASYAVANVASLYAFFLSVLVTYLVGLKFCAPK